MQFVDVIDAIDEISYHDITYDDVVNNIYNCKCNSNMVTQCMSHKYLCKDVFLNTKLSEDTKMKILDYYINSKCCTEMNIIYMFIKYNHSYLIEYFILEYMIIQKKYDLMNTKCFHNYIYTAKTFSFIFDHDKTIDLQFLFQKWTRNLRSPHFGEIFEFIADNYDHISEKIVERLMTRGKKSHIIRLFEKQGPFTQDVMNKLISECTNIKMIKLLSLYGAVIETKYIQESVRNTDHEKFLNFIEMQNLSALDRHICIMNYFNAYNG
jgi:hypothetical protein